MKKPALILWFKEIDSEDIDFVGQKGIGLAEMVETGISIPNGFCVTSLAYSQFLKNAGLIPKIKTLLQGLDSRDPRSLGTCSQGVKRLINSSKIPEEIAQAIMKNYLRLGGFLKEALVAVRCSPLDERLNVASFLNIKGEANVVEAVKKCWASLFEPENLLKRKNLSEEGIGVLVERMVQAQVSGVAFSTDPENKKEIVIRAIYGLGELAAEGKVIPDEYRVNKYSFKILQKEINPQPVQLIKVGNLNKQTVVPRKKQNLQKLSDQEIVKLAQLVQKIQRRCFFPQEVEWAMEKRRVYVLQTRPITNSKFKMKKSFNLEILVEGKPASPGIISGYARVIKSSKEVNKIKGEEVLVVKAANSSFLPGIRKIAGLVIEEKDPLSYGAMISRELGIPCVVGAERATKVIKTGMVITINGKTGKVLKGGRKSTAKSLAHKELAFTRKSLLLTKKRKFLWKN